MKVIPVKDDDTLEPPSTKAMHAQMGVLPPFLHPVHLELVFELRE